MRIALDTIGRTGRDVSITTADDWAEQAVTAALDSCPTVLEGHIEIAQPHRDQVDVTIDVQVSAPASCDRCAEPTTLDVHARSQLRYRPLTEQADDAELATEELDVGWYADDALDLATVLSEAVALAVPSRTTCDDAEACDARTDAMLAKQRPTSDVGHPGFAALRTINE